MVDTVSMALNFASFTRCTVHNKVSPRRLTLLNDGLPWAPMAEMGRYAKLYIATLGLNR